MTAAETRPLSRRQTQIWRLIAMGLTDREIADSLRIRRETASAHVKKLYKKLNVNSRLKAALLWRAPELA